jgi:cation transport regulator ChaC
MISEQWETYLFLTLDVLGWTKKNMHLLGNCIDEWHYLFDSRWVKSRQISWLDIKNSSISGMVYKVKKYTMSNRSDRLWKREHFVKHFRTCTKKEIKIPIIRRTNSVIMESPDKFQKNIIYSLKLQLKLTKIDHSLK